MHYLHFMHGSILLEGICGIPIAIVFALHDDSGQCNVDIVSRTS